MTQEIDSKVIEDAVRNALTPLRTYDMATDTTRPVTQEDVDRWAAIAQAAAELQGAAKRYIERMETIYRNGGK